MENRSSVFRKMVAELLEIAVAGLPHMFNADRQLFCYRLLRRSDGKLVQEGISHRYTMMTVLGLQRLETSGQQSPIPLTPILDALTRDLAWISGIGDLGMLLWSCAAVAPELLEDLSARVDIERALERHPDAKRRSTTEMAWLLAGLAHARLAGSSAIPNCDQLARRTYDLLKFNQGSMDLFGHLSTMGSISGRLRGRIGTFADQVYPIYAFAKFGLAYADGDAIRRARICAEAIIRLQGSDGEWWWHYDAPTGRVTRPYPVYSVHQHAMGPMALLAIGNVVGSSYTEPIERGLRWVFGMNGLGLDMRDTTARLVWRNIYLDSHLPLMRELRYLVSPYDVPRTPHHYQVTYECRPYELGWLLYAFALDTARPRSLEVPRELPNDGE